MADEELESDFKDIKPLPKKRSKLKWLLGLVALLLIGVVALFGLVKLGYVEPPPEIYNQVEKLLEGSFDTIKVEPAEDMTKGTISPPSKMPLKLPSEKSITENRTSQMTGGYYLKIASCLNKDCETEYKKNFKHLKLPLVTRKSQLRTSYYELISESSFLKKRAEEKLRLLNKYNKTNGFPYLIRGKNRRLKISFGQFPQKSNAIRMKSHLEYLYPQIRMRFLIRLRRDQATITKLYAGPYDKKTAEITKIRLQKDFDFEWVEVTKNL